MRTYSFEYIAGTSRPSAATDAASEEEFYKFLKEFLIENGGTLVPGSITFMEFGKLPDPPFLDMSMSLETMLGKIDHPAVGG